MPLYDYACDRCGHVGEVFYKLAEKPEIIPCSCGGKKRSLCCAAIFRVEPTWLNDGVRECLQDSDAVRAGLKKPIVDRDDYNHFMKENPHIQPI